MATGPSALFILSGANPFHQFVCYKHVAYIGIKDLEVLNSWTFMLAIEAHPGTCLPQSLTPWN